MSFYIYSEQPIDVFEKQGTLNFRQMALESVPYWRGRGTLLGTFGTPF